MSFAVFYNLFVSMYTAPLPNLLILQGNQRARVATSEARDQVWAAAGKYMMEITITFLRKLCFYYRYD